MKRWVLTTAGCMAMLAIEASAQTVIDVQVDRPGIRVSPRLYGIFFEEISRAGDGGLYAEMLQNRSFEDFNQPVGWTLVSPKGGEASMSLDQSKPLRERNSTSLRLEVTKLAAGSRVGIYNQGFKGALLPAHDPVFKLEDADALKATQPYAKWLQDTARAQAGSKNGLVVLKGKRYSVSWFVRADSDSKREIEVSLEKQNGSLLATRKVAVEGQGWKRYEVELQPNASESDARFVLSTRDRGTLWFDMVSMFPADTFLGRRNGLRPDLMEMLQALHPAFVRFPGGSYGEGYTLRGAFRWKETIGDVEDRPGHWNIWGYRSSDGLGFHELLQMTEDLGAEPLYVPNCGIAEKEMAAPADRPVWIEDALDAVAYANAGIDTKWGALRAKAGHPKPFQMKLVEIGNENGMSYSWGGGNAREYASFYLPLYRKLKSKYPGITTIATAPIQKDPIDAPVEIVDEHYYPKAEWFEEHADMYDSYSRKGPKIYVGEYAVKPGAGRGNLKAALGEAAFMTGMERNSDVVVMSSYAPLLVNANWKSWEPDAIVFDSAKAYGTPSYYNQMLFATNRPDVILPLQIRDGAQTSSQKTGRDLFAVAGRQDASGDIVLKVVNVAEIARRIEIDLSSASTGSYTLRTTVLTSAHAADENSFDEPKKIAPVASSERTVANHFEFKLAGNSVTVLRLHEVSGK